MTPANVDVRVRAGRTKFGLRLRAARKARGRTLRQLGDQLGVHWTYLGQVERGEREIRLGNILGLCLALGIDPGDFMRGLVVPPDDGDKLSTTDTFAPGGRTAQRTEKDGDS